MTVQRRDPETRPEVPPPSGDPAHGWGMDHLEGFRERQRFDARRLVAEAQQDAEEALAAGARLVWARYHRDREVLAVAALEAPTVEFAPVAPPPDKPDPDAEDRKPLEEAKAIYLRELAAGVDLPAAEVNRRIGKSLSFIRRKDHLEPWRQRWEAQHRR